MSILGVSVHSALIGQLRLGIPKDMQKQHLRVYPKKTVVEQNWKGHDVSFNLQTERWGSTSIYNYFNISKRVLTRIAKICSVRIWIYFLRLNGSPLVSFIALRVSCIHSRVAFSSFNSSSPYLIRIYKATADYIIFIGLLWIKWDFLISI